MKRQRLQEVNFIYFGSTLSRVGHVDDAVNARIAKASVESDLTQSGKSADTRGVHLMLSLRFYRACY